MNKLKKISIMLLGVLIIGTTISLAATGVANTDELRVRKEPSTAGEIITYLYKGNEVEIVEKSGDWYKIKYQSTEGYVRGDLLDTTEETKTPVTAEVTTPATTENPAVVTTAAVVYPIQNTTKAITKMYILPLITSSTVFNIEQGKTITINKVVNNWSYILYENKSGWVRNYIINTAQTATVITPEITAPEITTPKKGYINVDSANLRETASTSAKVLTTLILNTQITISGQENDWYKIEYGEYKGYVSKTLVSDQVTVTTRNQTEPRVAQTQKGYINVGVANVRSSASTKATIVTTLKQKTEIEITGEDGDFYIININNTVGYIAKKLVVNDLNKIIETKVVVAPAVSIAPVAEAVTTENVAINSAKGNEVVTLAKTFLGYSYVSGGNKPETGFDCTGFTYYIYNQCGYKLDRSISAQAKAGTAVEKANLQPGDLLIFNNESNSALGHTGIYLGNGKFIHAANPSRGVTANDTIDRIDQEGGYYYIRYVSARRLF